MKNCSSCLKELKIPKRVTNNAQFPGVCKACVGVYTSNKTQTYGERCNGNRSRIYSSWTSMRDRVYTKTNRDYKEGIAIHSEWEDFTNYKAWAIEQGYTEGSQIRRINSNGNYTPDNCKVITRPLAKYEYKGKEYTAAQLYDVIGSVAVTKAVFRRRLKKGYDLNRAIMEPPKCNQFSYRRNK